MASVLKVDDLRGNTASGNITITSEGGAATMQLQQGVAKTWLHYNQTTNNNRNSLSISSVADTAAGHWKGTLSNPMADAYYVISGAGCYDSNVTDSARADDQSAFPQSTTVFQVGTFNNANQHYDNTYNMISIHGDLA